MPIDISFIPVQIAILTVSDTRRPKDDRSGDVLEEKIMLAGHKMVDRDIVRDDVDKICAKLKNWVADDQVDVVITTGGTGVTGRDVTPEALESVWEKEIPGFGELFRWVSFQTIATSTIQSRACAGVAGGTYMFALPGSPNACKDGWEQY